MQLCQQKLLIKQTTSLCSLIHQIFVFYVFYCNLKEKDHIRRNINSKKYEYLYVKSVLFIILICQKLGSIGPVQQKTKLPLPKRQRHFLLVGLYCIFVCDKTNSQSLESMGAK